MKTIRIILLTILCLSVGFTQASALKSVTSNSSFTQQNIKKSTLEVIKVLERGYIFPEKSKIIAHKFRYKLAFNQFNQVDELGQFINELAVFIREVSGDSYLDIFESNSQLVISQTQVSGPHKNVEGFGFEKVEILSGNIGYLKLNHFYENSQAELQAARSFNYLSGADAIIIDLRDVEGDSILLAQYIMSFFVEENSILLDVLFDKQKKRKILKSVTTVGYEHFKHDYPVYILTSAFTAGTGELFSYTLKHLNKAVIVGKPTMGVALISKKQKVNEFITINMPIAIPIHPLTQTNWEQEGVVPDFNVKPGLSFELAYKLAKENLGIF